MIIASQNWDGVTPPALPGGWYFDAGFATTAAVDGVTPVSSPNMLVSAGPSYNTAYYQSPDNSSGNVRVTAALAESSGASGWPELDAYLFARCPNPRGNLFLDPTTLTLYAVRLSFNTSAVYLIRYVDGVETQLAEVGASFYGAYAYPYGAWFQVQLICDGAALAVNVQALSDGNWLQTNGTWAPGQVNCLSFTDGDAGIYGSGYAGLAMGYVVGEDAGDIYADNFLFESLIDPTQRSSIVAAGYAWWLHD